MKKSVIVLFEGLRSNSSQALIVAGHLAQSIAIQSADRGETRLANYVDGSGVSYPPLSWWPVIILSGRRGRMWTLWDDLEARQVARSVFFATMFEGGTELQMDRTRQVSREDAGLMGIAAYGEATLLDPASRQFSLWRASTT